jgi:predicted secreted Zn-dependent protease
MIESGAPQWRRSTKCASGNCVEVAEVDGQIMVRDSKNPGLAPLPFTQAEWRAFVAGVKADEFSF